MRIVVGLVFLAGCSRPAPVAQPRGGELRTFLMDNPRSLDPVEAADTISGEVAGQIFEGLLQYRPYDPARGLELVPAIAERAEIRDGGRVHEFTIRRGVFFHDDACFAGGRGREVTADDVAFSVTRSLRHGASGELGLALEFLRGARDFHEGRASSLSGIETDGPWTIRFHLTRPWAGLRSLLAFEFGWVVPREAFAKYGDRFSLHPVGTGPFRLGEWDPSDHILLVRNDRYWERDAEGARLPHLERVRMDLSGHTDYKIAAFVQGNLDVVWYQTKEHLRASTPGWKDPGVVTFETPRVNTIGLGFNLARDTPYAKSPLVRQALAHAVDLSPITDPQYAQFRPHTLLPPGLPEFDAARRAPDYDLGRARALLAEAGYPEGRGLPPLTLQIPEHDYNYRPLVSAWQSLGIDLTVRTVSRGTHWDLVARGEPEFFRWGVMASGGSAESVYSLFWGRAPRRDFAYRNDEYDRTFEVLLGEADAARRKGLAARLEAILAEDRPLLFVRRDSWRETVQPWVRNYGPSVNPFALRFFKIVRLEPRP